MNEQTEKQKEQKKKHPILRKLERFTVDSLGKLILLIILIIVAATAVVFHWGGFVGSPLVHASIRFMFGMNSSWDSLDIDWLNKKVIIKNLVIYQPEGFTKEIFFKARLAQCELNRYSGTEEFNIKKLAVFDPKFTWEFNKQSDSMHRFFEYLHSGKERKEEKYNLRIDRICIQGGSFDLYDYVTSGKGVHIGIQQVQSEMLNISNYYAEEKDFPASLKISGMLRNSQGSAVTPVDFRLDMNLITYAANFKAFINTGHIDLRILDPYCVDTMGLHLTNGTLGFNTLEAECKENMLQTRHTVNLNCLDFEPCKPGESNEEPWLNLVKWIKRLDAPTARHEFTVDLNGIVGKNAHLELSTSDMTIRVVFEKLADAFKKWFKGKVQLKRRKKDYFERRRKRHFIRR